MPFRAPDSLFRYYVYEFSAAIIDIFDSGQYRLVDCIICVIETWRLIWAIVKERSEAEMKFLKGYRLWYEPNDRDLIRRERVKVRSLNRIRIGFILRILAPFWFKTDSLTVIDPIKLCLRDIDKGNRAIFFDFKCRKHFIGKSLYFVRSERQRKPNWESGGILFFSIIG